jgi:hypothetical protein
LLTSCVGCAPAGAGKGGGEGEEAAAWMRAKGKAAEAILAGLTEGDLEKVRANAQAMHDLGYLEKWGRADTPGYKAQVGYFEFANRELIRQAKARNIGGATLAYTQLVVTCVQCHKVVRDAKPR